MRRRGCRKRARRGRRGARADAAGCRRGRRGRAACRSAWLSCSSMGARRGGVAASSGRANPSTGNFRAVYRSSPGAHKGRHRRPQRPRRAGEDRAGSCPPCVPAAGISSPSPPQRSSPEARGAQGGRVPIKVGLILPMTGPFQSTGRQVDAAVRLCLQERNGTRGRPADRGGAEGRRRGRRRHPPLGAGAGGEREGALPRGLRARRPSPWRRRPSPRALRCRRSSWRRPPRRSPSSRPSSSAPPSPSRRRRPFSPTGRRGTACARW